jgi:hypothetical protein
MQIQSLTLTYCRQQYLLSPEWAYTAGHCILWLHSKQQHASLIPHLEQAFSAPISRKAGASGFTSAEASMLAMETAAHFLCDDFETLCAAMPTVMRSQVLMIRNLVWDSFLSKGLLQEPPAVAAEGFGTGPEIDGQAFAPPGKENGA